MRSVSDVKQMGFDMFDRRTFFSMTAAGVLTALAFSHGYAQDTKVNVQLGWLPGAEFAGEYIALSNGYFSESGLDVTLLPGGPGTNSVQELMAGIADISITYAPPIMYSVNRDVPLATFAAALQKAPLTFYSLAEANITSVADWEGKRIGAGQGAIPQVKAVLANNGLSFDDITFVQAQVPALMQGQVDVVASWPTNTQTIQPIVDHPGGHNTQSIWDNGLQFQSNYYIATRETLDKRPEILVSFLEAVDRGWAFVADNPDAAVEIMVQQIPELEAESLKATLQILVDEYVYTEETKDHGFGNVSADRWQETLNTYAAIGEISEELTAADVMDSRILETSTRTNR